MDDRGGNEHLPIVAHQVQQRPVDAPGTARLGPLTTAGHLAEGSGCQALNHSLPTLDARWHLEHLGDRASAPTGVARLPTNPMGS